MIAETRHVGAAAVGRTDDHLTLVRLDRYTVDLDVDEFFRHAAFAPNWSVGFEYDHLFMGTDNKTFISTGLGVNNLVPAGGIGRAMNISQDVDMVTARINYRFGGSIVPRY